MRLGRLDGLFSEAKALREQGRYETAAGIYTAILTEWKGAAEVCERASASLGEVYMSLRDLRLAERYLKQALSYTPTAANYHYLLGFTYCVGRQWAPARLEFEATLKQDPENPEYLRGLGWVLCNCGRASEGQKYLLQALALAPDDVSILTNLALVYADVREFDKALEYAERAARSAPTNIPVQLVYKVLAGLRDLAHNTHTKGKKQPKRPE